MKKLLFAGLILMALITGYLIMTNRALDKRLQQALNVHAESVTAYSTEITRLGDTIQVQGQRVMTLQDAVKAGIIEQEQLRAQYIRTVQSYAAAREEITNLKQIIAGYTPEVIIIRDSIPAAGDYLKLPARWTYADNWMTLKGTNTTEGVVFEPGGINILNEPQFTFALRNRHKSGLRNFLSRPEPVVIYFNPNPYASMRQMENIMIAPPVKWYERKSVWFASGMLFQAAINTFVLNR